MLRKVQIADPASVLERYPHQLSGGMQQRVVIAMALAKDPTLLILDEPTTGLDATVEAEVLELVLNLRQEFGTSVLFISHNLAVIAKMCDRVGVLYAGSWSRKARRGRCSTTLATRTPSDCSAAFREAGSGRTTAASTPFPASCRRRAPTFPAASSPIAVRSPTTAAAARSRRPSTSATARRAASTTSARSRSHASSRRSSASRRARSRSVPIVHADGVSKTFRQAGHRIHALSDVSRRGLAGRDARPGGRVGKRQDDLRHASCSGSRRPTTTRRSSSNGKPLGSTIGKRSRDEIRAVQIVFQNPDSALNQRHTVRRIVGRALTRLGGLAARRATSGSSSSRARSASRIGISPFVPTSLSGGLKQRVAIARAFAGNPQVVVCDEPTSALDVSVQAAILNLLAELQRDDRTAYVFISHDLGVVRYLSDRIAVLYLGRLMELGERRAGLLRAAPSLHGGAAVGRAHGRRDRGGCGSGWRARSRAPRIHRPAVSSTRAAHGRSARSASRRNRRSPRWSPAT